MTQYASQTSVSVEKSRTEIEHVLERYGADQFAYGRDDSRGIASIQFCAHQRHVRFLLTLPRPDERQFKQSKRGWRSPEVARKHWEQACRQRWRALVLCVKAKLEAVESRISTFEDEFMAHILLPGGRTVGEVMRPQIERAYLTNEPPAGIAGLLPPPEPVEDNE